MKIGAPLTFNHFTGQKAAQVTRVWSPSCVNLVWFDDITSKWLTETSVPIIDQPAENETGWGCWSALP